MEELQVEKVISNLHEANEKLERSITDSVNRWIANYIIIHDLPEVNTLSNRVGNDNTYPNEKYCISIDYTRDLLYDLINYFKYLED